MSAALLSPPKTTPWPAEALLLLLTAPLALLAERFPPLLVLAALGLLLVPAAVRQARSGRFSVRTPADVPLAVLMLLALPISLAVSPFLRELSWPKLASLVWAVAVFYAVVNWLAATAPEAPSAAAPAGSPGALPARLGWLTAAYVALGAAFTAAGLLITTAGPKFPALAALAANLPTAARALVGRPGGMPANEAGGMLTLLFLPALALLIAPSATPRRPAPLLGRAALGLATLFFGVSLILSQSRAAWLGVAAGMLLMFVLLDRRGRAVLLLCGGAGLAAAWLAGLPRVIAGLIYPSPLAAPAKLMDTLMHGLLNARLEIWQRALFGIADFPLTGMGLGAFRRVLPFFYPPAMLPASYDVAHAHNLLLQTALDLGLPGLAAFVALLVVAAASLVRLLRSAPAGTHLHYWLAGAAAGLVAHLGFSSLDAIALGGKPGVLLWLLLGMVFGLGARLAPAPARPVRAWAPGLRGRPGRHAAAALLLGLALAAWLGRPWLVLNAGNITLERAAFVTSSAVPAAASLLRAAAAAGRPEAYWSLGLLGRWQGDEAARQAAQASLIRGSAGRLHLLSSTQPDDGALAAAAFARYPDQPAAQAWQAAQLIAADPAQAVALYSRALAADSWPWDWWMGLGRAYEALNAPQDARRAYEQGCARTIGVLPCHELARLPAP